MSWHAYLRTLKIHVVVTNLEVHSEEVHQRDVIAAGSAVGSVQPEGRKFHPHMSVFVVPQAIISLIPILKRPPVSETSEDVARRPHLHDALLLTMEIYSSSVGHTRASLQ